MEKYLFPAACVCGGAVLGAALWRAFALPSANVTRREEEEGLLLPSAEATLALIKSRRSFFPEKFVAGEDVPKAVINNILEAANWAPTHGNTEPWRFVVRVEEKRAGALCAVCCVLCCVARPWRVEEKGKREKYLLVCDVCVCGVLCVVCCVARRRGGRGRGASKRRQVHCALYTVHCTLCTVYCVAVCCVRCAMGVADTYRDHLCTHTQVVLLALFPAFFPKVLDRANIVALMDIKRRFTEVQVRDLYHIHIQCTIRSAGQREIYTIYHGISYSVYHHHGSTRSDIYSRMSPEI